MKILNRSIKDMVLKDLEKKIILLVGPRQVGKTTFSKFLVNAFEYLNYDSDKDRLALLKQQWNRDRPLVRHHC